GRVERVDVEVGEDATGLSHRSRLSAAAQTTRRPLTRLRGALRRAGSGSVQRRGEPAASCPYERVGGAAAIELADDQQPHVVARQSPEQQLKGPLVVPAVERSDPRGAWAVAAPLDPPPHAPHLESR